MDQQEIELEELVEKVNQKIPYTIPPMFELYATLFSISTAIMFFLYPKMLYAGVAEPVRVYTHMQFIMPQSMWACAFFVACMLKAIGLIFNYAWMRKTGLLFSSVLYAALTVCFALTFPSIGAISFGCMTIFTVVSVPLVKHTTIRHPKS